MGKSRKCCCCICISLILVIVAIGAALAAFFLWARPPSIDFNGAIPPADVSKAFVIKEAPNFSFNLRLNFTVNNPNFVGAILSKIDGEGYLPTNKDQAIGSGSLSDVDIAKSANTTLLFPVEINYDILKDNNLETLKYIIDKCGLSGKPKSKLDISYIVKIAVKVVAVSINIPDINNNVDFDCPIPAGTTIPGLDLILKFFNGQIPNVIDPTILKTLKDQLSTLDPNAINQIKNAISDPNVINQITQVAGSAIPVITQIAQSGFGK